MSLFAELEGVSPTSQSQGCCGSLCKVQHDINNVTNLFTYSRINLFTSKKTAFTLTELVTAMVVLTMIVLITLPITLHKMKKVDYDSYYLGYAFVKDISANVLPDLLKDYNEAGGDDRKCAFEINGTCYGTPFFPEPITKAECEAQKGNLGINACYYPNDYWAGAVKACGGTQNMPTQAQLAEIASYIYNTDVSASGITSATRDDDKASALGFSFTSGSSFYVYSGEEYSRTNAYARSFHPSYAYWHDSYRDYSDYQAVCIVD